MNNKELLTFAAIISVGLITPDEYVSCCDDIIREDDEPSALVLDLALIKDNDMAVQRLLAEAYGRFEEDYSFDDQGFYEVCSEFLKYKEGKIGWAKFLGSAMDIADHDGCHWSASEFKRFLDSYESSGDSSVVAQNQANHLAAVFEEELVDIEYYRNKVRNRALTKRST